MSLDTPLAWYEDEARGGWTGVDHQGVIQARITVQADVRRPWLARSRTGWCIDYPDDELDRAKRAMDHVWCRPAPPPIDPRSGREVGREQRRGPRPLRNRPEWAPPHPGTVPARRKR